MLTESLDFSMEPPRIETDTVPPDDETVYPTGVVAEAGAVATKSGKNNAAQESMQMVARRVTRLIPIGRRASLRLGFMVVLACVVGAGDRDHVVYIGRRGRRPRICGVIV
ncbi:hypothetical protein GOACH_01_01690 [Gordonia aichiensis NBRC 108223]|uniref:Uncharacterized protein n=1 Tax=Gordonia aichiensis NBRC 108223 TaxID=1220583 RepID=L7KD96_9ACTN|nr:hypothetical protein GOACH_01_01690 [Gordonia aichiensis NBRC 108223]